MLRINDARLPIHVGAVEPVTTLVPSRRQAIAAFQSIVESLVSLSEAEANECRHDLETLRRFIATR